MSDDGLSGIYGSSGDDLKHGPRVVDLPTPDKERAKIEELQRGLPHLLAAVEVTAKIRRAYYLALVREGFTEAQALDLCWR